MLSIKEATKTKQLQNSTINISGIEIQLLRKNIKNINFSIRATDQRVRVSVPFYISEEELLTALHSKLDWMHAKLQVSKNISKAYTHNYYSGEIVYFLGKPYRLEFVENPTKLRVTLHNSGVLKMHVNEKLEQSKKERLLTEWYRAELKQRIPLLLQKWQPIIGKKVTEWRVKKMRTRWGSCNINKKRIWLNLELAKQPEYCLEYVVVHEMTHLLERNHNARFKKYLDEFIPEWKSIEAELNTNQNKR